MWWYRAPSPPFKMFEQSQVAASNPPFPTSECRVVLFALASCTGDRHADIPSFNSDENSSGA